MDMQILDIDSVLKAFENIPYVIDERNDSKDLVIRCTIATEDEGERLFSSLCTHTQTQWNRAYNIKTPKRFVFHSKWQCHLSSRFKKEDSKRNANCTAVISIKVKKITAATKRNDHFLKLDPPLPGKITISLQHTHVIKSAVALRLLRVSNEVKEQFFKYFKAGLSPSAAVAMHEDKFLIDENYEMLANASQNPTRGQVYYLHSLWRRDNFGSFQAPLEKLKEELQMYEETGEACKKRFKNLRDRFAKFKKSQRSGGAYITMPDILMKMEFLSQHLKHRQSHGNYPNSEDEHEAENLNQNIDFPESDDIVESASFITPSGSAVSFIKPIRNSASYITPTLNPASKRKRDLDEDLIHEIKKTSNVLMKIDKSENDIFGDLVARSLDTLTERQCSEAKVNILQYLHSLQFENNNEG